MELSHESHEHPLFFVDGESDSAKFVRCWGCGDQICGARYSCSTCKFQLHKSCTELPPRLDDHPFHPQHPLSLLCSPYTGSYRCHACGEDRSEIKFVYHCSLCGFDLDPMCALSVYAKVSIVSERNGEKELFRYGAYQHLLMLESTSLQMGRGSCCVCSESISAPFFFCSKSRCGFRLHKSCADLRPQIRINFFHPQHPLFLFSVQEKECQICGQSVSLEQAYVCIPCDFSIHPRCAFSNSIHAITRRKNPLMDEDFMAQLAELDRIFREDPPEEIQNNYFHPQHTLCLDFKSSEECKICGKETDGRTYTYDCKPCDFCCHLQCALLKPIDNIKRVGEQQFQHSSHSHSLTLLQDEKEYARKELFPHCGLCEKEISFPSYGCHSCNFLLHKSCAELPPQIKTHLHPHHFLFLFESPPPAKPCCDCCDEEILGLNYQCLRCDFILHLDCFLSLHGGKKLYDHKHNFINLETFLKTSCQTCGEEGYFSPWLCSSCHILVHKKCADLPRILKLESHHHCLKLTHSLSLVHERDQMKCKLCHRKVNVDSAAYYCSGCNYAAHLQCAPKVGVSVLEEENQDDHHAHSSKESQNSLTNSDITSSQEEDIKSSVIQHFSHQHQLTLIEQNLEDHKYCKGCVGLIFSPFYSCKQCNFYLHKRCGESPKTKKHPFHDHLLTLNVVEDLVWCDECGCSCNGFMYSCQAPDCTFNLDLQCADILLEGLQHPCHEHRLFFPYTRKDEKCNGCGKMQKHILVCSECDYALGYCCLRIPHVAKHRYDNHMLNLTYKMEDESGEYYCDICEEKRDSRTWFYCCSRCEFFAHIDCTLGGYPYLKYGTTLKSYSHHHPLTLVEKCKRKTIPLCSSCGKHCYSRVLECCQCNLHFHINVSCLHSY